MTFDRNSSLENLPPRSDEWVEEKPPVQKDRPGVVGGVILLAGYFWVGWYGHYRQAVLLFFLAHLVVLILFNVAYLVVGRAGGARPLVVSVGFGGWIARVRVRSIEYRLAWALSGGYVKFHGMDPVRDRDDASAFMNLPLRWKVATALSGSVAAVVLGVALLGAGPSVGFFQSFFRHLHEGLGTHPPLNFQPAVRALFARVGERPWSWTLGVVALWQGAANLLPVPTVAGGQALMFVVQAIWPRRFESGRLLIGLQLVGMIPLAFMFILVMWTFLAVIAHG